MAQLLELRECVGIDAIVIPDKGAALINSDAIKTSAGALYNVKICKENNLAHGGFFFNNRVLWFCSDWKSRKINLWCQFSEPCAIVMGNEETGISKEVLHHADEK